MATKQKHKKRHGFIEPSQWRALINSMNQKEEIDNPKNPVQLAVSLQWSLSLPSKKLDNLIIDGMRDFEALQKLLAFRMQKNVREKRERDTFLKSQMAAEIIQEQKRQELVAQSQNHTTPAPVSHANTELVKLKQDKVKLAENIAALGEEIKVLESEIKEADTKIKTAEADVAKVYADKKTDLIENLKGAKPFIDKNGQEKTEPVVFYDQHGKEINFDAALAAINHVPEPPPLTKIYKINPAAEQHLVKSEDREANQAVYANVTNVLNELLSLVKLCEIGSGEGLTSSKDIQGMIVCNKDGYCYRNTQLNNQYIDNEKQKIGALVDNVRTRDGKENLLEQKVLLHDALSIQITQLEHTPPRPSS